MNVHIQTHYINKTMTTLIHSPFGNPCHVDGQRSVAGAEVGEVLGVLANIATHINSCTMENKIEQHNGYKLQPPHVLYKSPCDYSV